MKKRKWSHQEIMQWLDENHKLLYINPNDRNILIRKRYGIAWTFNWGNPMTWVILFIWIVLLGLFICFA